MKKPFPGIVLPIAIALSATTAAHGFYEIGRGAIFLNTRAGVSYETNIYENRENTSDVIFRLNPQLEYIRRAGRYNVSAHLGASAQKFMDNDREDSVDLTAGVSLQSSGAREAILSPTFRVAFDSRRQAIGEVGTRARTDTLSASTGLSYQHSDRVIISGSLSGGHTRYSGSRQNLSSNTRFGVSEQITYIKSSRINFFGGHNLSYSFSSGSGGRGALKPLDNTVYVGVGGQISPKISGSASVGYTWRQFLQGDVDSAGSLYASAGLNWQATDRRTFSLSLSRTFDLSPLDQSTETTTVSLGVSQRLTDRLSASAGTSYSWQEITGPGTDRTDTIFGLNARLNFNINRQTSASAGYSYTNRGSDERFINSQSHRFDISASYRF